MSKKNLVITGAALLIIVTCLLFCGKSVPQLKPLSNTASILAFGDSLTFGVGAEPEKSYPAALAKLTNLKVIREGVPGELSANGLKRLPKALDKHQPDLLILCHGGNDFLQKKDKAETRKNIEEMIKLAIAKDIQVILIGVPRASITLSPPIFYQELSDKYKLPYEDSVMSKIIASPDLKSDQIHPNEDGYQLIAERIHKLLQQSGSIPK